MIYKGQILLHRERHNTCNVQKSALKFPRGRLSLQDVEGEGMLGVCYVQGGLLRRRSDCDSSEQQQPSERPHHSCD